MSCRSRRSRHGEAGRLYASDGLLYPLAVWCFCYNKTMRKWTLLFLCLCAAPLWAQVSVISVTDEDKHKNKEDFYHTFEYYVLPAGQQTGQSGKCQATRIGRRWFATAAHCVKEQCKNGCTVQMDLLEYSVSALARVTHTAKKPAVFVHPGFSADKMVKDDFALIRLDLARAPQTYYRRSVGKRNYNLGISKQEFAAFLEQHRAANRQYRRIVSPDFPPIVLFDEGNYIIDRKLSVISIFGGKREIKPDPYPVHYVKALGFAYTNNFGIRKGMSGSGVMTNTGELIGIISANLTSVRGQSREGVKTEEYFMFPVFNRGIASFMESVMGSDYYKLDFKDAYPSFVNKSRRNYAPVVEAVNWVNEHHTMK